MEHRRIYVANAESLAIAKIGQSVNVGGTVSSSLGFGTWGIETTTVVDMFGSQSDEDRLLAAIFEAYPNEEAVYVMRDPRTMGETVYRARYAK